MHTEDSTLVVHKEQKSYCNRNQITIPYVFILCAQFVFDQDVTFRKKKKNVSAIFTCN